MRKLLFSVVAVLTLVGCNQAQVEQLEWQRDSLLRASRLKDSSITLFAETMSDLQQNLNTIKAKEGIVTMAVNNGESVENINDDIDAIYKLLVENKDKVAKLQRQLNKISSQNKEYEKLITVLQAQIEQQNAEIERLNSLLNEKDIEINHLNNAVIRVSLSLDSLSTVNRQTTADLGEATDKLNTAYYIVGTKKELKQRGVITSDGLFSKKVSAESETSLFTEIDIRNFDKLNIGSKKVKMLSQHPTESFEVEETAEGCILHIRNAENFWSRSRFLVIQER